MILSYVRNYGKDFLESVVEPDLTIEQRDDFTTSGFRPPHWKMSEVDRFTFAEHRTAIVDIRRKIPPHLQRSCATLRCNVRMQLAHVSRSCSVQGSESINGRMGTRNTFNPLKRETSFRIWLNIQSVDYPTQVSASSSGSFQKPFQKCDWKTIGKSTDPYVQ